MRLLVTQNNIGRLAAEIICNKLNLAKPSADNPFVLCLPTGGTPLTMYQELIKLYRNGCLSFKHVISFNMDEYVGLDANHQGSYHYYMQSNFFKHIDISPQNINILDGMAINLEQECASFEAKIAKLGGIDLTIGGVGTDGHIAFNEPFSAIGSRTRVKTLDVATLSANARFFTDNESVPSQVLTVGIQTILDSKEVIILAKGLDKASAIAKAVEGAVSSSCPLSALQLHRKAVIIADELACYELKLKTLRYFEGINDDYRLIDNDIRS